MDLIIVESPTKAKTISKFINKSFVVESSFGHIRDLPKSNMGIDVENNFFPKYMVPNKAKKTVSKLKELVKKSDNIILATDEDREGEAIAWHLSEALKIKPDKTQRIVFHEITKDAILEALKKPRKIDFNLVNAQQARRVLDRLVGYELSPFLWKKVSKGLSAGRVQSVAVRLTVEREKEIEAFESKEYWTIKVVLEKENEEEFIARLNKIKGKTIDKFEIKNEKEAKEIISALKNKEYQVIKVEKKSSKKNAPKPFTTSTLQQTANRWLGFSAKQTMMLAQQLYEGVETENEGQIGLITYMRTDSLNLSGKFINDAKDYLKKEFGNNYCLEKTRIFKTKTKGAQEAHEAIRPTEAQRTPQSIKDSLNNNQYRLYKLIWQRAIASQMPEAVMDLSIIDVKAKESDYEFRANGQMLNFDGYLKIYPEKSQETELPNLSENEKLKNKDLQSEQHFSKPPARYSDAGLVKELEKHGIGRPSTYAPTISTIIARNYVERDENKKLKPTAIATVVNNLLSNHFKQIVDYDFTAQVEDDLDKIAQGKNEWQKVIADFYHPFKENLTNKYNELNKKDIMPEEKTNEKCDKCGAEMIIKIGRYGKFLACSAFPDCKNIKNLNPEKEELSPEKKEALKKIEEKYKDEKCDKCGAEMTIKNGRFGPFLACSAYPKCRNIKNIAENNSGTGIKCPLCNQGEIVQKRSKRGVFYACNKYPDCKNAYWSKPNGEKCPKCQALMIEGKEGGSRCSNKDCQ